jgi:ketosteroid isomerase-like protein
MSENIESLRALIDAFNRRDFEAAVQYAHPEVELRPGLTELDVSPRYRGREELRHFFETISEAWESYVVTPEEILTAPGDRVLAVERWRAVGRGGLEFDLELCDLFTFRDGLIVRIDGFRDKAEALEAARLTDSPR